MKYFTAYMGLLNPLINELFILLTRFIICAKQSYIASKDIHVFTTVTTTLLISRSLPQFGQ
jgi:predicted Kef-type K+ transport protein